MFKIRKTRAHMRYAARVFLNLKYIVFGNFVIFRSFLCKNDFDNYDTDVLVFIYINQFIHRDIQDFRNYKKCF